MKKGFSKQGLRVFVGMSGGVDSSVSAALLKQAGYDVTGVFLKVWHPDWLLCEWKEERRDAMRAAAVLDIPFLTLDLEAEYKKGVVDYMFSEYKQGRTPNPDVMCNKEVKFGSFLKRALELGADFIATGHYAQNLPLNTPPASRTPLKGRLPSSELGNPPLKGVPERRGMFEGADKNKDQSYFLWTLGQEELKHVLFPVGHLQKPEVRALAKKFKLPTAEKKDSQGICFIGKVDMKEFLSHYIDSQPGKIINEEGLEIGEHDGALFYTIGQRHGFRIKEKTSEDKPYYIVEKDISANTLKVSNKKSEHEPTQAIREITLGDVHWVSTKPVASEVFARIRYRQEKQECVVNDLEVSFKNPQDGVSIGQSLVFYNGDECLGGGIIENVG